ncbi:hypothetical protein JTB14_014270 [Gonioctena quinquepunctata]|nr:hypothetical protein JTB14_014270 [Gonioctena quinquepunctata]
MFDDVHTIAPPTETKPSRRLRIARCLRGGLQDACAPLSVSVRKCAIELEHPGGFSSSPWAAVLGHHTAVAAAAASSMMQTRDHHSYAAHHPATPIDLHVPQAFPYYRYRDDTLCWTDRKPVDEVGNPSSVNARNCYPEG